MKETKETNSYATFHDMYLKFYTSGNLFTRLIHKRDDFNFGIMTYQHLDNQIQTTSTTMTDPLGQVS